jgi:uncharacterized protein YndB with AHSA1/START domain
MAAAGGMKAHIYAFDPREDGTFRMAFAYTNPDHGVPGKSSEHADVFQGRFLKPVPDKRVVEIVEFESDDSAFAGAMSIITTLTAVPSGIRSSDHQEGMTSTLNKLAAFTE